MGLAEAKAQITGKQRVVVSVHCGEVGTLQSHSGVQCCSPMSSLLAQSQHS